MARVSGRPRFLLGLVALFAASSLAALALGPAGFGLDAELWWALRVPRWLLGAGVGAALALSGVALQATFSNPLAEPATLGISSGAALGAVIGEYCVRRAGAGGHGGMALFALGGALLFAGALQLAALRFRGSVASLLLTGVMLNLLGSSLVAVWMALADPMGISAVVGWLLGDLSRGNLEQGVALTVLAAGAGVLLWRARARLDAFTLGDETARGLGVDTARARRRVIWITSLLVAASVAAAGMVGFVGLMVPNLMRRRLGARHAFLLPASALGGASAVLLADVIARGVAAPIELPVGAVTAVLGAPVFLAWFLREPAGAGGLGGAPR